jgi:hypothetical protein
MAIKGEEALVVAAALTLTPDGANFTSIGLTNSDAVQIAQALASFTGSFAAFCSRSSSSESDPASHRGRRPVQGEASCPRA